MNLDELVAIDIHTHVHVSHRIVEDAEAIARKEAMAKYFKQEAPPADLAGRCNPEGCVTAFRWKAG